MDVGQIENLVRARRPKRVPEVLSREEVRRVLDGMSGTHQMMARLLYGTGMRLMECVRLRVKDVDFDRNEIAVRGGKGDKDRRTMLPQSLKAAPVEHLRRVKLLYEEDRLNDSPGVSCREDWSENTHGPGRNGHGSGSSPLAASPVIRAAASSGGITSWKTASSER